MARRWWDALLQPPPARAGEPVLARTLGTLFVSGGILGLVSMLLPHPAATDLGALAVVDASAFVIGFLLLAFASAIPHWLIHAVIGAGSALISVAIHFSSASAGVYATLFVWVAAYTALFLSRRAALIHLAWLLACYAVALTSITDPTGYSTLTLVLLTGIALLVVSVLISWLVERRSAAEERTQRFFDLSLDLLCTANADGYFVEVNDAWTEALGYSRRELLSRPYLELVHPDDRERTRRETAGVFRDHGAAMFENRYRAKNGRWHWLLWSSSFSPRSGLVFARATDITEAKRVEAAREEMLTELDSLARTDPLTGIPNRRWLDDELGREMSRAHRHGFSLGLAMLDLDHFKRFNDRHGHQAGDRLLRNAARRWRSALRASDFLARYGGEEFVVILPGCTPADAQPLIDRVRSATPGSETCSAGVAFWDGEEDGGALIGRADAALYTAKRLGRDRTVLAEAGAAVPGGPAGSA